MRFEVITDDIIDKENMKICEEENIRMVPSQKKINTIKAFCPDYEASRSINSGVGEPEKIANKRKNRRDYYARKKFDEDWMNKQREHNKQRMRERREDPEIKKKEKERSKEYYQRMSRDESFKQKEKEKNYKYRENVKQIRAEEKRKSEESREIKHNEYKCVCGSIIQLKEKQRHETTKRHHLYQLSNSNNNIECEQ